MDPLSIAGLVTGLISLYSTCRDCYTFFTEVRNCEKSSIISARELGIQEAIFGSWGTYWEIIQFEKTPGDGDSTRPSSKKLQQYLSRHPYKASGLADAFFCIAGLLTDRNELLGKYGLGTQPRDGKDSASDGQDLRILSLTRPGVNSNAMLDGLESKSQGFRHRLGLLKKCKWALSDHQRFKTLIADLRRHNDSLYVLCPDTAFQAMQLNFVMDYIMHHDSSDDLKLLPSLASQQPADPYQTGPSQQSLPMLIDLAEIKVNVQNMTRPFSEQDEREILSFQEEDLQLDHDNYGHFQETVSSRRYMALWTEKKEVVYIEMKSYETSKRADPKVRTMILQLGRVLRDESCVRQLHALKCLGLVDFVDRKMIGLVYQLPNGLGLRRRGVPLQDFHIRSPRELLEGYEGDSPPSLGRRFEIARKLAKSVAFLHASGWLHKNLCPESVYFFPSVEGEIRRTRDGIDWDNPYLAGYDYSRASQTETQEGLYIDTNIEPSTAPLPDERSHGERIKRVSFAPDPLGGLNAQLRPDTADRPDSPSSIDPGEIPSPTEVYRNLAAQVATPSGERDLGTPHPQWTLSPMAAQIHLNFRHHPVKLANPNQRYCPAFDIYSLGILLYEVGTWRSVSAIMDGIEVPKNPFQVRRLLLGWLEGPLTSGCGETYWNVVRECLSVDPAESEEELEEQKYLCTRIAGDLAQCLA
ncbi:prion-inhibition and propagation-domain-containing protein [Xylaria flabelliformis]|nr:prion-inhibition and propagation-domain-containing protein [Xylaria flabelliformis]